MVAICTLLMKAVTEIDPELGKPLPLTKRFAINEKE